MTPSVLPSGSWQSLGIPGRRAHAIAMTIGGAVVVLIGVVTLAGWLVDAPGLSAARADFVPTAPSTALLFMLLGTGVCALAVQARWARLFAWSATTVSLVVAGAHVAEYVTGAELGVDHWVFSFPSDRLGAAPGGNMPFVTALSFVLICLALLAGSVPPRNRYLNELAKTFALLVTLGGVAFSLGYLYDAPLFYDGPSIPMALPTAVAFSALGLSIVLPTIVCDHMEWRQQERIRAYVDGSFQHAAIGMALVAPDGRWLRVNHALCGILGYSERELRTTTFQALTHADDVAAGLTNAQRLLAGDIATYHAEKRYMHRQGHVIWALLSVSLVRESDGTPRYFISQIQDITGRKRAEAALMRQALVFDTISDGVIVMDTQGHVTDWNPAAERIFGYTKQDMIGCSVERIHHPRLGGALEREIQASLASRDHWAGELPFLRKDGLEGVADVIVVVQRDSAGVPAAWIGVNRDVTERKQTEEALRKTEEQFRQAQKMEAVGQLAGGVAHDFNNILTAIATFSSLLLEDLGPSDPRSDDAREITKAADRAAALTRQLLAFSRRQILQPRVLDLNPVVTELEKMIRRLVGAHITVVATLERGLGSVRADPGQMEQVLMNLVVNARDAMPDGGTIAIETANVTLDRTYARRHESVAVPETRYVRLIVSDTGCGMDEGTQARIFEPFFTTKELGRGTGLGLSTVYGIVKQSGGFIWCYSEQGRGTAFKIYMPRVDAAPECRSSRSRAVDGRGSETVLVVEDDETVRSAARRILTERGYTVLEATNGAAALQLCSESRAPIDLIVSDIVMPEMGGSQLARELRSRQADIRVLLMSGYTEDAALRQSFLDPGMAFLEKPFGPEVLAQRVREVLDTPDPAERAVAT
ncbi:MAG: PAS domain S-box protein [Gemmatimonadaceae bacterium]